MEVGSETDADNSHQRRSKAQLVIGLQFVKHRTHEVAGKQRKRNPCCDPCHCDLKRFAQNY